MTDEQLKLKIKKFYELLDNTPNIDKFRNEAKKAINEYYNYYINLIASDNYEKFDYCYTNIDFFDTHKCIDANIKKEYMEIIDILDHKVVSLLDNPDIFNRYIEKIEADIKKERENLLLKINTKPIFKPFEQLIFNVEKYYANLSENMLGTIMLQKTDIKNIYDLYYDIDTDDSINLEEISPLLSPNSELFDEELMANLENFADLCTEKYLLKLKKYMEHGNTYFIDYMIRKYNLKDFFGHSFIFRVDYPTKLLENVDFNLVEKIIYEYGAKNIEYIPDELFLELDTIDIKKIFDVRNPNTFIDEMSQTKIKKIIQCLGLTEVLRLCHAKKNYGDDFNSIDNDYSSIYESLDNISSEEFTYIIENGYYRGIEYCKGICKNIEYVKRLIEVGYHNILSSLHDEDVTDEILEMISEKSSINMKNYDFNVNKNIQIKSDKLLNLLTSRSFHLIGIDTIPQSKMTTDMLLRYVLLRYESGTILVNTYPELKEYIEPLTGSLNNNGIKYLVDSGFKLNSRTILEDSELNHFLNNGATYLIDLPGDNISIEILETAVKNGYKFSINSPIDNFPNYTFEYFLNRGNYDVITAYISSWNYIDFINDYVYSQGYDSVFTFLESVGVDTSFRNNMLYSQTLRDLSEEDISYLAEKNQDNPKNYQYLIFFTEYKGILEYVKSKEDIDKYFSESGPTKNLYDLSLFTYDTDLFYCLFEDDIYDKDILERIYSPTTMAYVEFIKEKGYLLYDIIKKHEDISKYFDASGPNKNLYDVVLFNRHDLFDKIYDSDKWKEIYNDKEDAKKIVCINFCLNTLKESGVPTEIIKCEADIEKYFDELGPTRELYNASLFENNYLYQYLFKDDSWEKIYSSTDKEIISYINFFKKNNIAPLNQIIKCQSDINKYFSEFGPTKALYDFALINNEKLFNMLFKDDNWKEYYKEEPNVIAYLNFINQNGHILAHIKNASDIDENFNEFGPTKTLCNRALFQNSLWSTDNKLFEVLFNGDAWENIYNAEEDKNIISYIKFSKKYGPVLNQIITDQASVNRYFNEFGYTEELKILFKEHPNIADSILSNAAHNNKVLENLDFDFTDMFEYYLIDRHYTSCENPEEKYHYLVKNIGPQLIFNYGSNIISTMILQDNSELELLFDIFNSQNNIISKQNAKNNIAASLLDYKFRKDKKDIVEVFSNVRTLIDQMKEEELEDYINELSLGKINSKNVTLDTWIQSIITELQYNNEEQEKLKNAILDYKKNRATNELHEICKEYIRTCSRKYALANQETILQEFGIAPEYDTEDKTKAYANHLLRNITYSDFSAIREKYFDKLNDNSIKGYDKLKTLSSSQFDLIIQSIKSKTQPDNSIKQEYAILKKFINKIADFYVKNDLVAPEEYSKLDFKGIQSAIALEKINMMKVISELDLETFLSYAKKHPKVLENLKKVINNYGLGRLPEEVGEVFEQKYKVLLPNGVNNIGAFITRYLQLLKNEQTHLKNQGLDVALEDIHMPFAKVIEAISLTNSETYELRRLLGKSEYYDFAANKGPNENKYDRQSREAVLEKIVDYLYTLSTVTIPSKDIIIESENGRKINFIVGNRTNPSNVCHGERTGACMRIGGVGEGLFLKCLTDKNWFHIRIEDPITHEYVSRVSGFRNGNTVYLNQLREVPKGSKYTNQNLQEYIKIYAQTLIDETKDSEYPIENVFINTEYAMKGVSGAHYSFGNTIQKEYNLNDVKDLRLGTRNDIWTDVRNSALLLATTEEGKKAKEGYVPLKNGPENAPIYPTVRDKIYGLEYTGDIEKHRFVTVERENLMEKINRVHAMKEKLLGRDYKYDIEDKIENEAEIIDGYASSDWYAYIDEDNNIHTDYISEIEDDYDNLLYAQSELAKQEMEHYVEILTNKYNLSEEVRYAV